MTKSMIATISKPKANAAKRWKARGEAVDNHAEHQEGRLIGDLPVGWLAGKYKDDPGFAAIMEEIHAETETVSRVLASIRDTVRTLPPERHDEMFTEFAEAVERRNIGHLADTIAHWALGGQGYKTAGAVVNRSLDTLPPLEDDPELLETWQEYKSNGYEFK